MEELTVDQKIDALPTAQISGKVSAVLEEAVESHRWANRKSRSDVLEEALTEWAETHKLLAPARKALAAKV